VGDHKFKIGQLVDYIGRQRAAGVYTVTPGCPQKTTIAISAANALQASTRSLPGCPQKTTIASIG
jgi:hypothetical protein